MQSEQKQFSLLERFTVVGIILLVSVMAIQNVLHSVKASERHTATNAAVEYATVKSMYAEQGRSSTASMIPGNMEGATNLHNPPIH